jgi:4-azaleucine resistance transporter AzlC
VPEPSRSPVRDSIVLGVAVGVFGVSFGVLGVAAGLSVAKTCVMSLFVFTGASQFAAVSIVASGGTVGYAVASALLLAGRNAAYGVALAPILRLRGPRQLAAAHITLDESTAMATAQPDAATARVAFWVTGSTVFVAWNLGTLAGALAGTAIGDPKTLGLDAAFPAGFVALLGPHLRTRRGKAAAAFAVVLALVLVPISPPGTPILLSALGIIPALLFVRPGADEVEPAPAGDAE